MPRKPRNSSTAKANVDVQAIAKATYSRKRIISEVIPKDVTRAKTGAWLDIISPVTQWAGLKGDALRHKRTLLRLQQEQTLSEIARRFAERRKSVTIEKPIPLKFMVPFLEQASLEDPDSSLVDLWANLLVSAAEDFNPQSIHYIGIIGRMSAQQGDIFQAIINHLRPRRREDIADEIANTLRSYLDALWTDHKADHPAHDFSDQAFANFIHEKFARPVISMVYCYFENRETRPREDLVKDDHHDIPGGAMIFRGDQAVDYSILQALGMLERTSPALFPIDHWEITVFYHRVTLLGLQFAKACGLVTG
jgi:hypothetical protein